MSHPSSPLVIRPLALSDLTALLQLYTGLIYAGPALITGLNKAATERGKPRYLTGGHQ